jgi:hypothetical protein
MAYYYRQYSKNELPKEKGQIMKKKFPLSALNG